MNTSKRIGILTLPLEKNTGGILQAYALQSYIELQGVPAEVINYRSWKHSKQYRRFKQAAIGIALLARTRRVGTRGVAESFKENQNFIDQYVNLTGPIYTKRKLEKVISQRYTHVIIGSDQVWRPDYAHNARVYFGDMKLDDGVKISTYAASFGHHYHHKLFSDPKIVKSVKNLEQISVRESQGVSLSKQVFDIQAHHVVDPTLLLGASKYEALLASDNSCEAVQPRILKYVLDNEVLASRIEKKFSEKFENSISETLRGTPTGAVNSEGRKVSPVDWLSEFRRASFVVTDSFHGMIFAFIFKKNFIVLKNRTRGADRFDSFLEKCGLRDRLISDYSSAEVTRLIHTSIDYDSAGNRISGLIEQSKSFLRNVI
ncbi:polysaccharide pyruvyl transferase family protein [Limimaricola pyoseonensis]|uniref:Polysaccharide pyruvyl transferase n=1 Tax=Limimaricola pyoseonensis TaxID=521013 RepID=A0A1G7KKZ8_9RHOB|nr:polysaccharide pyruvyl transferase family protein [Limimaricola pyoseonensis]SDF37724.1 Polysaccharide pyruvyl transferase [Limimaricola pyoseonensis]